MDEPHFGESSLPSEEEQDEGLRFFETYSDLDCRAKDIESIQALRANLQNFQNRLSSIRIINSDFLKSIRGIGAFPMLRSIVLSANQIEKMEDISNLKLLRHLDLSCNRIRLISKLQGLPNLQTLDLSGNRIVSILPLTQLAGVPKLAEIDLAGNSLQDLTEISKVVAALSNLTKLTFQHDEEFSNPFCQDMNKYSRAIQNLPKRDLVVDSHPVEEWRKNQVTLTQRVADQDTFDERQEYFGDQTVIKRPSNITPSRPQPAPRTQLVPEQQQQSRSPSPGLEVAGARMVPRQPAQPQPRPPAAPSAQQQPSHPPAAKPVQPWSTPSAPGPAATATQPGPIEQPQTAHKSLQSEFTLLLQQVAGLQTALDDKDRELTATRTERRELEHLVRDLEAKLQRTGVSASELDRAAKVLRSVQRDKERLELLLQETCQDRDSLRGQNDELKQRLTDLQKRLEDALVANVQLGKEIELAQDEVSNSKDEMQKLNGQLSESRRVVKGLESSLASAHAEALKNTEISIIRIEDLNARLREAESRTAEFKQSLMAATEAKNSLFEEKTRLEINLNNSLESLRLAHATELSNLNSEHRTRLTELEANHSGVIDRMREEQEKALNNLEDEYKKIMIEANQKHKKVVSENRGLREALNKSIARNQEVEGLLLEMGNVVDKVKKEREHATKMANTQQQGPSREELLKTNGLLSEQVKSLESDLKSAKLRLEEFSDRLRSVEKVSVQKDETILKLQKDLQNAFTTIAEKEKLQTSEHNDRLALESKLLERDAILHRITNKLTLLENGHKDELHSLQSELETQSNELALKSHLLREKSDELERLKSELESKSLQLATHLQKMGDIETQHKQKLQEVENEYNRLQHKYSKKDSVLDEYEEKIEALQNELRRSEEMNKRLRSDIVSQGKTADECLERLRLLETDKQRDAQAAKDVLMQAEERLGKLNALVARKDARVLELEAGIGEIKAVFSQRLTELQQENQVLKDDVAVKEREIRTLIFEIDRQKAAVKENLAGLTRMFS